MTTVLYYSIKFDLLNKTVRINRQGRDPSKVKFTLKIEVNDVDMRPATLRRERSVRIVMRADLLKIHLKEFVKEVEKLLSWKLFNMFVSASSIYSEIKQLLDNSKIYDCKMKARGYWNKAGIYEYHDVIVCYPE